MCFFLGGFKNPDPGRWNLQSVRVKVLVSPEQMTAPSRSAAFQQKSIWRPSQQQRLIISKHAEVPPALMLGSFDGDRQASCISQSLAKQGRQKSCGSKSVFTGDLGTISHHFIQSQLFREDFDLLRTTEKRFLLSLQIQEEERFLLVEILDIFKLIPDGQKRLRGESESNNQYQLIFSQTGSVHSNANRRTKQAALLFVWF